MPESHVQQDKNKNSEDSIICHIYIVSSILLFFLHTPQGAIRRELFFTRGIDMAVSAAIEKKDSVKQGALQYDIYQVKLDKMEEEWGVRYWTSYIDAVKIENEIYDPIK